MKQLNMLKKGSNRVKVTFRTVMMMVMVVEMGMLMVMEMEMAMAMGRGVEMGMEMEVEMERRIVCVLGMAHLYGEPIQFLKFHERLSLIDINVHRRVDRSSKFIEENSKTSIHRSCLFEAALKKWSDLNCTKHFLDLHDEIYSLRCVQSLPLLLHHRTKIVDVLLKHLKVEGSLAVPAIVEYATISISISISISITSIL